MQETPLDLLKSKETQAIQISEDLATKMATVAHHYDHADQVRKDAVELAKSEGLDDREVFLLEIASLWHDIGLDHIADRSRHPEVSAQIFLETFSDDVLITKEEKSTITFLVRYHDSYSQAMTMTSDEKLLLMLRILIDADTLELLGERGYMRAVETARSRDWTDYELTNPRGETYNFSSTDFDERFRLKREGQILDAIEPTLVGQLNFQISCADLLFTNSAKQRATDGVKFLKDKIISQLSN